MKNKLINISLLIVAVAGLWTFTGCEKEYTNIVSPQTASYKITGLTQLNSFTRTETDSVLAIHLTIDDPTVINGVSIILLDPDNDKVAGFPVSLLDNGKESNGDAASGDGIFTNLIVMSKNYVSGNYSLDYNLSIKNGSTSKAASQTFSFNNGQSNVAPVISNLTAPDTLTVNDTTIILLTIEAADSNGLADIERVFFKSYRPDGTTSGVAFPLYDNGRDGDAAAGDGIYSGIISVYPSNQKGTYRFEFQAIDRGKKTSNIIIHRITLL